MSKYDKNGNQIFSIGYPDIPHYYYYDFEPKNIDIAIDGTILVSSNKSIVKTNTDGTKITEYEIALEKDIETIFSINPFVYIINTQYTVYKSDSSFNLSDSIQFSNTINKLLLKNDTVYALVGSDLVRIDTSLNIIDTLFSSSAVIHNMELYDNRIWLQILQSDSIKLIKLKESDNYDTLVFPLFVNSPEFIVSGNNYTFVGNSFTNQIGIYNFETYSAEIENFLLPDIEIVDFDIYNVVIDYVQYMEGTFARGYFFNTELTIKNNGHDTITTFAVFSDLHGGMNCAQNYFYQKFTGLEILPGQTQNVQLNRAYEDGIYNNQLCFQCLAPNSKLEISTSDNSLCKIFTITGVKNEIESKIKIFPNPFSDYLIVECPDLNIRKIEIIDINGKILINKIASEQTIRIETSSIKTGLYILKVSSGDKITTELIMKK